MFSTLYFAATSSLSSESSHRTIFEHVMHGRISEAVAMSATVCDERSGAATASAADWQLYADLQLVLGRHDEAEDSFRKVHKSVRQSRDAIRIASCRNAAWQAFFQNRFSTALAWNPRTPSFARTSACTVTGHGSVLRTVSGNGELSEASV